MPCPEGNPEKRELSVVPTAASLSESLLPAVSNFLADYLAPALTGRSEAARFAAVDLLTERLEEVLDREAENLHRPLGTRSLIERLALDRLVKRELTEALRCMAAGAELPPIQSEPVRRFVLGVREAIKPPVETVTEVEASLINVANAHFSYDDLLSQENDPSRLAHLVSHGVLLTVGSGFNYVVLRSDIDSAFGFQPSGMGCAYSARGGWHYKKTEVPEKGKSEVELLALQRVFHTRTYLDLPAHEFTEMFDAVPESLSDRSLVLVPILYGDHHLGAIMAFREGEAQKLEGQKAARLRLWALETANALAKIQRIRDARPDQFEAE